MAKLGQGFTGERILILPFFVVQEMERDDLLKDLYIHSLGHFPMARHHCWERPDGCAEYVLIYCLKGEGWYILQNRRYVVSANQVFILPANEPHSYGANDDNPWTIYWIHFKGTKAGYFASGFSKPVDVTSRMELRIALFDEAYNTLLSGYKNDNLIYASQILGYFLGTFKCLVHSVEPKRPNERGVNWVNLVTFFMNENMYRQLTIEDLCSYTKYSPTHLHRLFLKATGYAPINYFLNLKIERACYYLLNTRYKVGQIAQILGFSDAFHFSKQFTKIKKVSPSEYRKNANYK